MNSISLEIEANNLEIARRKAELAVLESKLHDKEEAWQKYKISTAPAESLISIFLIRRYLKNMYGRHDFDNLVLKCFVACLKDNADDAQSTNIFPPTQIGQIVGVENLDDDCDEYHIDNMRHFARKRFIVKFIGQERSTVVVTFGRIANKIPIPSCIENYQKLCFNNNVLLPDEKLVFAKRNEIYNSVQMNLSDEQWLQKDLEVVTARKTQNYSLGRRKFLLRDEISVASYAGNQEVINNKLRQYKQCDQTSKLRSDHYVERMSTYDAIEKLSKKRMQDQIFEEHEASKLELKELHSTSRRPTFVTQSLKDIYTGIFKIPEDDNKKKESNRITNHVRQVRKNEIRRLKKETRKELKNLNDFLIPEETRRKRRKELEKFQVLLKKKKKELTLEGSGIGVGKKNHKIKRDKKKNKKKYEDDDRNLDLFKCHENIKL